MIPGAEPCGRREWQGGQQHCAIMPSEFSYAACCKGVHFIIVTLWLPLQWLTCKQGTEKLFTPAPNAVRDSEIYCTELGHSSGCEFLCMDPACVRKLYLPFALQFLIIGCENRAPHCCAPSPPLTTMQLMPWFHRTSHCRCCAPQPAAIWNSGHLADDT